MRHRRHAFRERTIGIPSPSTVIFFFVVVVAWIATALCTPTPSLGALVDHAGDGRLASWRGADDVPDTTAPVTVCDADADWHASDVTVTLTATDDLSGVASTTWRLDGGAWQTGTEIAVVAPADHSGDGVHSIDFSSIDVAGNVEAQQTAQVRIDTTAPHTRDDGSAAWRTSDVSIALSAGDAGAGVATTEFRLDEGAWQVGTTCTVAAPADHSNDGVHVVFYRSSDRAGNVEPVRFRLVGIRAPITAGPSFLIGGGLEADVDGDWVVYSTRNGSSGKDINLYSLGGGLTTTVCAAGNDQEYPAICGTTAVWQDWRSAPAHEEGYFQSPELNADVWGYDLTGRRPISLCTAQRAQLYPQTDDRFVTWHDQRGADRIAVLDRTDSGVSFMTDHAPTPTTGAGFPGNARISNGLVAWDSHFIDTRRDGTQSEVRWSDVLTHEQGAFHLPYSRQKGWRWVFAAWPSAATRRIVFSTHDGLQPKRWGDLYIADTRGGPATRICNPFAGKIRSLTFWNILTLAFWGFIDADVDDNLAVWADLRNGRWVDNAYPENLDIYLYDSISRLRFPVCTEPEIQSSPRISGSTVVWRKIWDVDGALVSQIRGCSLALPRWMGEVAVWPTPSASPTWMRTRPVTLRLFGRRLDESPAEMRFSTDGVTWTEWEPYATSRAFTLPDGDGAVTVAVQFRDGLGEASPVFRDAVAVDTTGPWSTTARSTSARAGRRAALRYRVFDALSPEANVTIRITTLRGTTVKTLRPGRRPVDTALRARLRCTFGKGRFRVIVTATDLAGNRQVGATVGRLTVR